MKKILYILLVALCFCSCSKKKGAITQGNSMYYWQTSFTMNENRKEFLKTHNVSRLYVRYFDVVLKDGKPMPNATISFKDSMPENVEIIPTVFIMNDCMKKMDYTYADRILSRIKQINETHGIKNVKEIQIDCDWTKATEEAYMDLMNTLYNLCKSDTLLLSSTIRLYQLGWKVPKSDRGVLMVYNTGDFRDIKDEKPILDIDKVGGYLKYLKNYQLPLTAAYPLFKWEILFRNNKFVGIMNKDNDFFVFDSDTVIKREPSLQDILKAKQRLQEIRPSINKEVILYDLGDYNINRFTRQEYETLFNH